MADAAIVTASGTDAQSMPFSVVAKDLKTSGIKSRQKPVVGKAATHSRIKSVTTKRSIDVFVSRLHPATDDDDVMSCVSYYT